MFPRCALHEHPKKWKYWLSKAEFWYNTTHHTSLGCSPFRARYGHDANVGLIPPSITDSVESVPEVWTDVQGHTSVLREQLARAQNRMKLLADKKRKDQEYTVREQVLLKLQPYAQSSLVNRPYPKLAFKYYGPYKVLERIGRAAYRLELSADSLIHPIFHVSQLKSFVPDYTRIFSTLPPVATLDREELLPEAILERRLVKKGAKATPQVLIKWTNTTTRSCNMEGLVCAIVTFSWCARWRTSKL